MKWLFAFVLVIVIKWNLKIFRVLFSLADFRIDKIIDIKRKIKIKKRFFCHFLNTIDVVLTPFRWWDIPGTYVVPGVHLIQFRFNAGRCRDPRHRNANRNSSAISEQIDCRSACAFFFEFQQNSKIATNIASANPHIKTTNTPPKHTQSEKKKTKIKSISRSSNQICYELFTYVFNA